MNAMEGTRAAWLRTPLLCAVVSLIAACSATPAGDPLESLGRVDLVPARQLAAMRVLDADPKDPAYIKALRRIVVQPGYARELRDEAWTRLVRNDPEGLKEALELGLPKLMAYEWRTEVCKRVAELGWKDMTQTLVRAWVVPLPILAVKLSDRPEYHALCAMWGTERVPQVLFDLLLKSDPIKEANLRARCWELLLATGQRQRIVDLLADSSLASTDAFILDMRRCATDLGVIPANREEILWMRALRAPGKRAFWEEARAAAAKLTPEVRATLEPRDIPMLVAVGRTQPQLLERSRDELLAQVTAALAAQEVRRYTASFEGYGTELPETPRAHAASMRWGDCAAVLVAREALGQEALRRHLFDIADRDQADRRSEYGGLLRLDAQGRYELVEFPPTQMGSDVRFEAPNDMFEAGYDALFHFHNHAQAYDNRRYAGPHHGDFGYADATGVNGLVFTFVDRDRINADFYRRGKVVIDLGEVARPDT